MSVAPQAGPSDVRDLGLALAVGAATAAVVGLVAITPAAGLVSVEAPLGRALLGKREGDVAIVQRPSGPAELTVVEIRWEAPEA